MKTRSRSFDALLRHGTPRVALPSCHSIVQQAHHQIDLVERLAGRTNANAATDLDVAALLLECAAKGAAANVTVNLPAVDDEGFADAVLAELDQRLRQIQGATARTRERVRKGGQRSVEST